VIADTELWLPVVGFEACYRVSDWGNVRSIDRVVQRCNGRAQRLRGRPLQQAVDKLGRHYVALYQLGGGESTTHRVHVLVLTAFIGERPPGAEGCHWDDDPSNNFLPNLRWATSSENKLDRVRNGIHHNAIKTACPLEHLLQHPNLATKALPNRNCLACTRTYRLRTQARLRGEDFDFRAAANVQYAKIMEEAA